MVDCIGIEPMTSCLQSRRSPSWTNSPYGGFNGSRTHLYTVTVYYTNRYTMKPKFYVFILFYSTPAIFLRGHSMHTGRLYSCFDFTGSSLRPKLSNRCFDSYSDIQLVCVDINIDSHNYNYLPANEIFGLRHYPCLSTAIEISLTNNCSHLTQATFLWVYLPWMIL